MRMRGLFVIVTVAGLLAALPGAAQAGGNWLDIRRDDGVPGGRWDTWSGPFVPGTAVEVRTSVYTPGARPTNRLRDSGPYFAWLAPEGGRVDVNSIPDTAIRLSAFTLRWASDRSAVAHASFVVPAVPSGRYTIEVCNDPCSLSGFGEYVQGWTSVVQSAEAAVLQRDRDRFHTKFMQARQDVGQARRDAERLQTDLRDSEETRMTWAARAAILTDQLDSARRRSASAVPIDRTFVDPWVGALLAVAMLLLAAARTVRYRARRIVVPDTLEELLHSDGFAPRTAKR